MDALQFAYWLQGFAELNEQPPTPEQWKAIREHLGLVFRKVTPPVDISNLPIGVPYRSPTDARERSWWERREQCAAPAGGMAARAECRARLDPAGDGNTWIVG